MHFILILYRKCFKIRIIIILLEEGKRKENNLAS